MNNPVRNNTTEMKPISYRSVFSIPSRLKRVVLLLVIATLSINQGCRKTESPTARPPLRIGIDLWPGYYPLIIAQEKKLFEKHQVEVEIAIPQDTRRMIADFAAHEFDMIAVSLGDMILITSSEPQICMILCCDESHGGDQILGSKPFDPEEVPEGTTIGTALGGFGELFVRRILKEHQLSSSQVSVVNLDAAEAQGQIKTGQVTAGHTWEPYASAIRNNGGHVWYSSKDTPGLIFDGIVAHENLLSDRQIEMKSFFNAWFEAVDWWLENPDEGNRMIEKSLDQEEGSVSLQGVRLMTREDNRKAFSPGAPGESIDLALAEYVDFFIARGALSKGIAPDAFLNDSLHP